MPLTSDTRMLPASPRPMALTAAPGPLAPDQLRFIARAVPANAEVVTQAIIDLTNFVRAENHVPLLNVNARAHGGCPASLAGYGPA